VTLLVADDDGRSVPAGLAADAVTVGAEAVSAALAANDPDVVVVDGTAVRDTDEVVRAVRAATANAGIVVVSDDAAGADVTRVDPDEASVRDAVERAERVADYRRSVASLYDAARDRALGRPDGDVRAQRKQADDCFSALPEDEETFAALLRTDDEDGTGSLDEGDGPGSLDAEDADG
jgi:DNA-binding NarL/FixJ family response regulator